MLKFSQHDQYILEQILIWDFDKFTNERAMLLQRYVKYYTKFKSNLVFFKIPVTKYGISKIPI